MQSNNVLSDSAVKEIESLVGADIRVVVAFDVNGNAVPLRPSYVTEREINISKETPLDAKFYTINSAAYGSFAGSTCIYWTTNGKTYSYCF